MRWYLIALFVIAFLVGSLFRATEQTGMRIWNMFASMGIFLFGLIGTLALARAQRRSGMSRVESALKALEPDWVITDWSGEDSGQPDYLLAGPDGILAVCIDETAGSSFRWRARQTVERSCQRAEKAAVWVRERLKANGNEFGPAARSGVAALVRPVVILTRRRTEPGFCVGDTTLINPDQLGEYLCAGGRSPLLDQPDRFRLTRFLREAKGSIGGTVKERL